MARRKQPAISDELLDQLLAGADPKTAFAKDGLLDELKKAFAERALNAEIDHHLNNGEEDGRPNSRNGYGRKSVLTETAKIELEVPRDRLSTFDPQLIAKYQRRFPGFDEKIVSMYARGMSVREIQGHLRDLYGVDVSADLVSAVTDAVLEEIAEWQNRPLEPLYALVPNSNSARNEDVSNCPNTSPDRIWITQNLIIDKMIVMVRKNWQKLSSKDFPVSS